MSCIIGYVILTSDMMNLTSMKLVKRPCQTLFNHCFLNFGLILFGKESLYECLANSFCLALYEYPKGINWGRLGSGPEVEVFAGRLGSGPEVEVFAGKNFTLGPDPGFFIW